MSASRGTDLAELEREREFLLGSLRDLEAEREAGDLDDADYRALHDDYTARAAAVLRRIRTMEERPAPRGSAPRPSSKRWQRVLAAAVVASTALAAVVGVLSLASGRQPGQPASGDIPTGVAGRLAQAHDLEARGEAVEAIKLYDSVLRDDPGNVEALAYRGWLLRLAGLTDEAQESLDQAVAIDPTYPDARFFRGMLLFRDLDDPQAAVAEFEAFLAADPPPEVAAPVLDILEQAEAAAAAGSEAPPAG